MASLSQQVLFRHAIALFPDPATLSRWKTGEIVAVNQAFLEHLQQPRDEVLGRPAQELPLEMPAKQRQAYEKKLSAQGEVDGFQMFERFPDGREVHMLLSSRIVEFEGERFNLTIGKDVTELIETQRALTRSQEQFEQMFQQTPLPAVVADLEEGRIQDVNQAFTRVFGWPREQLINVSPREVGVMPEDAYRSLVGYLMTRQKVEGVDIEVKTAEGKTRTTQLFLQALPWEDGTQRGLLLFQDVTKQRQAQEKMEQLAMYDQLTELPNRTLFMDRLEQALRRSKRHPHQIGVLFVDLDDFKRINDTLGHTAGDELLQRLARRLKRVVRESDTLARLSGDEFAVLLESAAYRTQLQEVASRLLSQLEEPFELSGRQIYQTASVGGAISTENIEEATDLLRRADLAMYAVKEKMGPGYEIYSSTEHTDQLPSLRREQGLHQALEQEQFRVGYQPIVDLESGQIVGGEALLRWQHPKQGLIPAREFIGELEDTGLIMPVGQWVIEQVLKQAGRWHKQGLLEPTFSFNVNLSVRQLAEKHLAQNIASRARQADVAPSMLQVEITENLAMRRQEEMQQMRRAGIRFALDDFGTGYSSLDYLRRLEIDSIKIDCQFVRRVQENGVERHLVEALLFLADRLDIAAIAEGVETQQQLETLQQLGCSQGQGWLFAPALLAPEFGQLVQTVQACGWEAYQQQEFVPAFSNEVQGSDSA